jgi:hypothetical protein
METSSNACRDHTQHLNGLLESAFVTLENAVRHTLHQQTLVHAVRQVIIQAVREGHHRPLPVDLPQIEPVRSLDQMDQQLQARGSNLQRILSEALAMFEGIGGDADTAQEVGRNQKIITDTDPQVELNGDKNEGKGA